jgi:hypothetical protein
LTGAFLLWSPAYSGVGSHSMELCGAFLSGTWPARAGECPPWFSACGSRFAFPASFCVDPGYWRSLDAGRAPGVGVCFSRPCYGCGSHGAVVWFSSVCICYCTFFSLFTVYPFGSCFKSGFFGLCGWSFFSFIHCFGLRACCCLRAEISASVFL